MLLCGEQVRQARHPCLEHGPSTRPPRAGGVTCATELWLGRGIVPSPIIMATVYHFPSALHLVTKEDLEPLAVEKMLWKSSLHKF